MQALDRRVKLENEKLVTEEAVLEYLARDKATARILKEKFEYEFQDLERRRPDIVDSWSHYKKFKNLF